MKRIKAKVFTPLSPTAIYHIENTGSRPITEVKQRRARLVLGWVTAWEHRVQLAFHFAFLFLILKFFLAQ